MLFYLGTHLPHWLRTTPVPLFISHRRLKDRRTFPRALQPWALDSGGFTELSLHGRWATSPSDYVTAVRRYADEIGMMQWAAPQDAMCEPWVLDNCQSWLGGTVDAHQRWSVDNLLELRTLASDLPFIPVLQGWDDDDYLRHVEMYVDAGVSLFDEPLVGLGSVCRRQATGQIVRIVKMLSALGLRLHGFGVKTAGLAQYANHLVSADSMAWSLAGRRQHPCPQSFNKNCASCWHFALDWHSRIMEVLNDSPIQL